MNHFKTNNMNENALKGTSTIEIKETATGKARVGFRKTDGVQMDKEEYYRQLEANGYKVERTKNGVFISVYKP